MSLFDDTSTTTTAPTVEAERHVWQPADEREEPTDGKKWVEVQPPTCPVQDGRYCRSTCAWWIDGSCAAVVAAMSLRDIAKNGIEAYTYPN